MKQRFFKQTTILQRELDKENSETKQICPCCVWERIISRRRCSEPRETLKPWKDLSSDFGYFSSFPTRHMHLTLQTTVYLLFQAAVVFHTFVCRMKISWMFAECWNVRNIRAEGVTEEELRSSFLWVLCFLFTNEPPESNWKKPNTQIHQILFETNQTGLILNHRTQF